MNIKYSVKELNNILKQLTILYIEDEDNIRNNVTTTLKIISKQVFDVNSVEAAEIILINNKIDIVITDINLPEKNGLDFVAELRKEDKIIPIIILSAYTDLAYLLKATKLKLINYLTKPINFKILHDSLLQAVEDIIENSKYIISFENYINYNVLHKKLFNNETEKEILLTSKELLMLDYLIEHNNRVISHDELKINIWEDSFDVSDSALKNLLNKLRKKVGKSSITNISNVGYRIHIE
jgi:DNA-binding response OmpR family regulator